MYNIIIIEKIYVDNESSVICLIQMQHHGWCKDTTGPEIVSEFHTEDACKIEIRLPFTRVAKKTKPCPLS